eukprot:MONOS_9045.1-p1 / transcript=MONOS_9045.1 / gene=MONOS_9045 / organism=Monocercomonoides_exilis_PA203 / gene_product=unspecified product / transcript_product=unspecified product / location=Mono_scaffold00360:5113-7762(-) / protein_length=709 / sequence_SO=supercontig / SO=protein_coding / is_pseudo=false
MESSPTKGNDSPNSPQKNKRRNIHTVKSPSKQRMQTEYLFLDSPAKLPPLHDPASILHKYGHPTKTQHIVYNDEKKDELSSHTDTSSSRPLVSSPYTKSVRPYSKYTESTQTSPFQIGERSEMSTPRSRTEFVGSDTSQHSALSTPTDFTRSNRTRSVQSPSFHRNSPTRHVSVKPLTISPTISRPIRSQQQASLSSASPSMRRRSVRSESPSADSSTPHHSSSSAANPSARSYTSIGQHPSKLREGSNIHSAALTERSGSRTKGGFQTERRLNEKDGRRRTAYGSGEDSSNYSLSSLGTSRSSSNYSSLSIQTDRPSMYKRKKKEAAKPNMEGRKAQQLSMRNDRSPSHLNRSRTAFACSPLDGASKGREEKKEKVNSKSNKGKGSYGFGQRKSGKSKSEGADENEDGKDKKEKDGTINSQNKYGVSDRGRNGEGEGREGEGGKGVGEREGRSGEDIAEWMILHKNDEDGFESTKMTVEAKKKKGKKKKAKKEESRGNSYGEASWASSIRQAVWEKAIDRIIKRINLEEQHEQAMEERAIRKQKIEKMKDEEAKVQLEEKKKKEEEKAKQLEEKRRRRLWMIHERYMSSTHLELFSTPSALGSSSSATSSSSSSSSSSFGSPHRGTTRTNASKSAENELSHAEEEEEEEEESNDESTLLFPSHEELLKHRMRERAAKRQNTLLRTKKGKKGGKKKKRREEEECGGGE